MKKIFIFLLFFILPAKAETYLNLGIEGIAFQTANELNYHNKTFSRISDSFQIPRIGLSFVDGKNVFTVSTTDTFLNNGYNIYHTINNNLISTRIITKSTNIAYTRKFNNFGAGISLSRVSVSSNGTSDLYYAGSFVGSYNFKNTPFSIYGAYSPRFLNNSQSKFEAFTLGASLSIPL